MMCDDKELERLNDDLKKLFPEKPPEQRMPFDEAMEKANRIIRKINFEAEFGEVEK